MSKPNLSHTQVLCLRLLAKSRDWTYRTEHMGGPTLRTLRELGLLRTKWVDVGEIRLRWDDKIPIKYLMIRISSAGRRWLWENDK